MEIDHRVHSRIIGGRGRGVRRITEEFNVDLRFPGRDADNPDVVVITGDEDAVVECKDHLLQLEDEFVCRCHSISSSGSSSSSLKEHYVKVVEDTPLPSAAEMWTSESSF